MNPRQIEAFRAVARSGTVTAAAGMLNISQPAVSRLLSHLELQLSLQLFSRAQGRLRLTPEGNALLREVERHFVGLDAIRTAAQRIAQHGPGSLRIVAFPSLSSGVLPLAIVDTLATHADTVVTLDTETSDRIAASVESGAYDVGFTTAQIAPGEAIEARIIASRPWVCVFPNGHPLSQQDLIRMTDLRQEKLVGFSPGMSLRDDIDRIFVSSNLTPNYAISAQTIESICALVAAGCGIAVIHPYARHVAQMRGLATAELNHREQLDLSVVTQQKAQRARFTDQFVEIVERKLAQPGT